MAALANATVHVTITASLAGSEPISGALGKVAIPIRDGTVDLAGLRRALSALLCEAGSYLLTEG